MSKQFIKVVFFFLLLPAFANADVSKIVFITEPQEVKPGELSGAITIQSQDGSGNSSPTLETLDLVFTSTSATGEFLGSTGNAVTKTMNRNTANRTFYYRDSAEGNFTLTVSATGRDSGATYSASQSITISANAEESQDEDDEEEGENTSGSSENNSSSSSSHYSSSSETNFQSSSQLKIGAGRSRSSTVGTPIEFTASSNSNSEGTSFLWSFGDGSTGVGDTVTHTYHYPGEYVVVLNASSGLKKAVSRTSVTIKDPELVITKASPEIIEISNTSDTEVNLYGRALVVEDEVFAFPQDTIIGGKNKIIFSTWATGLKPASLLDTHLVISGNKVRQLELVQAAQIRKERRLEEVALIQERLKFAQEALEVLASSEIRNNLNREVPAPVIVEKNEEVNEEGDINILAATVAVGASTTERDEGFWHLLKEFFLWRRVE